MWLEALRMTGAKTLDCSGKRSFFGQFGIAPPLNTQWLRRRRFGAGELFSGQFSSYEGT